MAIAKVQGPTSAYDGSTSPTASFSSTPTQGNLLIAVGYGFDTAAGDYIAGGWTLAASVRSGSATYSGLWYRVAGAAEPKDVELDWTGSLSGVTLVIAEWGGFTGTPTLDKTAYENYTSAVTSKTSGTTATTTANDELCLALFRLGGTISAESWSNSFATEYRNSTTPTQLFGSRVMSSTWTAETTLSWTTARYCGGLIATFKGVVTSTWTPKVIMVN